MPRERTKHNPILSISVGYPMKKAFWEACERNEKDPKLVIKKLISEFIKQSKLNYASNNIHRDERRAI